MADPQAALATQLRNIETKTGKTLAQLRGIIVKSGLAKHGEVRSMLIERFALGYGDANTLAHAAKADAPAAPAGDDALDAIYAGAKAGLRPLHDAVMKQKQFAMVGPATKDQIEIGLNAKSLPAHARLKALPPGGMCQYAVRLSSVAEVDATLLGWVRSAYDASA
jgi:Domain of unknown function (DUF4287)/Domain of unknown function (DUF5655)